MFLHTSDGSSLRIPLGLRRESHGIEPLTYSSIPLAESVTYLDRGFRDPLPNLVVRLLLRLCPVACSDRLPTLPACDSDEQPDDHPQSKGEHRDEQVQNVVDAMSTDKDCLVFV